MALWNEFRLYSTTVQHHSQLLLVTTFHYSPIFFVFSGLQYTFPRLRSLIIFFVSLDLFQWSSLPDVKVEESQHTWQRGADLAENHSPLHTASSYSLADLLALYGSTGDRQQQPLSLPAPLGDSQMSAAAGEQDGTPGSADWILPSKKKRNFSLGVAGMCCNQGCTKNDIGRLC